MAGRVKGGYEVRIARSRAFCPFSQIDIVRTESRRRTWVSVYSSASPSSRTRGRNIVVSRRALLEEAAAVAAEEVRQSIVAGAVITGRVVSVREFGVFVDLGGGVQGLLHVSEMGWSRMADPATIGKPGDEITVKVLRVDEATQKIALGLKQSRRIRGRSVASSYEVGQVRPGRVTRMAEFGAFVELEPGDRGAGARIHVPADSQRGQWSRRFRPDMTGAFEILSVDPDKKRIGVALVPEGSTRASSVAHEGDEVRDYLDRENAESSPGLGSLADQLRGALGPRKE